MSIVKEISFVIFTLILIASFTIIHDVNAQSAENIDEYCQDNWKKSPQLCVNYIPEGYTGENAHDYFAAREEERTQQRIEQFQLDMQNIVCPIGTEKQASGLQVTCVSTENTQTNPTFNFEDNPNIIFYLFVFFIIIIIIVVVIRAVSESEKPSSYNLRETPNNNFENFSAPVKTKRESIPGKHRHEVLQRDNYRCRECGASTNDPNVTLEIDHIRPVSKGGTSNLHNLQTLCKTCNRAKHTRRWFGGK